MPKETSQRKQAESAEQIFSLIHGLIATLHYFYIPQVTFSEKSNLWLSFAVRLQSAGSENHCCLAVLERIG